MRIQRVCTFCVNLFTERPVDQARIERHDTLNLELFGDDMKRHYIVILLLLAMVVYVATARTRAFGPNGMSDATDAAVQIANAVEHLVSAQNTSATYFSENGPIERYYLVYESVEEFRTLNPDCCRFSFRGSDGWLPSSRKRTATNYAGVVTITYILRRVENGDIIKTTHQTEIPMNASAEPIPLSKVRMGRFE